MISFQTVLFSQQNKSMSADIDWNGTMCNGGQGACYINTSSNESESNANISFNKENKELIIVLDNAKLDTENKSKLLNNELEKGFHLYTFDTDFILSNEIKTALDIKEFTKIKQGNYLIRVIDDSIIIKLKLE